MTGNINRNNNNIRPNNNNNQLRGNPLTDSVSSRTRSQTSIIRQRQKETLTNNMNPNQISQANHAYDLILRSSRKSFLTDANINTITAPIHNLNVDPLEYRLYNLKLKAITASISNHAEPINTLPILYSILTKCSNTDILTNQVMSTIIHAPEAEKKHIVAKIALTHDAHTPEEQDKINGLYDILKTQTSTYITPRNINDLMASSVINRIHKLQKVVLFNGMSRQQQENILINSYLNGGMPPMHLTMVRDFTNLPPNLRYNSLNRFITRNNPAGAA